MKEHHDWISETIAEIDAVLERPPISIQDAINEAIDKKRMTLEEGMECLEAYERSFHDTRELYPDSE